MAWQLVAIWMIVAAVVTWFIRDERRRRSDAELARAARYYAHAPQYQHRSVEAAVTVPSPVLRRTLDDRDRAFMERFLRQR